MTLRKSTLQEVTRRLLLLTCAGALLSTAAAAGAREPEPVALDDSELAQFLETYRWGITERRTDDFTKMTGWRVSQNWHFGYQQGEDDGISLVWQGTRDQMSISVDGIRFTRRF